MSIQESLKRFNSNKHFSNPLDRLDVSSSRSSELIKSPEEHTLSSLDAMRPQRISEILDSIGDSQRFTVLYISASPTSLFFLVFRIQALPSLGFHILLSIDLSTLRDMLQP